MIPLKLIDGTLVDLSKSKKFVEFYNKPYSKSSLIIDQFNSGKFPEIPEGNTFLDIGGNIGLFSIFVSPYYKHVIMLEPTPEHLEVADDLITSLGIENIHVIDEAYWPFAEEVTFNVGTSNSTMNSIASCPAVQGDTINVCCTTLKDLFFLWPTIDFVKMDIEGAENDIYLHEDFKNVAKAKRLLMEVHAFPDLRLEDIRINLKNIRDHLEAELGMTTISDERDELYMRSE